MSEAAERDYFYEKSALFTWMLELMPQSAVRSRALRAFVEFLRHTEADVSRRTLWFAFVNRLLELARGSSRDRGAVGDGTVAPAGALAVRAAGANRARAQTVMSSSWISCS